MAKVERANGLVERRGKWTLGAVNKFIGHFVLVISAHGLMVKDTGFSSSGSGFKSRCAHFVFAESASIFVSTILGHL